MRSAIVSAVVSVTLGSIGGVAHAQNGEVVALPAPTVAPTSAPVARVSSEPDVEAPAVPVGAHVHDGSYIRVASIFGGVSMHETGPTGYTRDLSGFAAGLDLRLGGTLDNGVVIGFHTSIRGLSSPSQSGTDSAGFAFASTGPDIDLFTGGAFVEWYPNVTKGFHFGGALDLAGLFGGSTSASSNTSNGTNGWVLEALGGYDVWVGSNASVGFELRGLAGSASGTSLEGQSGVTDRLFGAELLVSVLSH